MSLTLQQVICNASKLAKRLEEEDGIADTLLSETNQIHQKIDAMKQVISKIIICLNFLYESTAVSGRCRTFE